MIVVDASSLVKYLLKEENWHEVEEHLARERAYTVSHAVKELLNALWRHVALLKTFSREIAIEKWTLFKRLAESDVIVLKAQEEYLEMALNIALDHGITVYDSLYIACASKLKASLLSSDEEQSKVAEMLGLPVIFIE